MTDQSEDMTKAGTAFVFVVHGGSLEAKSALLACSLRQKLYSNNRIVAALMEPVDQWGALQPATKALLDELQVEISPVQNMIDPAYPHGNKINALSGVKGPAAFLDSDMMMMKPFVHHYSLLGTDSAMKPADIDTFSRGGGGWGSVYDRFGFEKPAKTLVATATGEKMCPYYNAGFIWVKDGVSFSESWVDTSRQIDADPLIYNKRPWLDQIALPLAVKRLGWSVNEAGPEMNYPAHIQDVPRPLPYLVHYHWPRIMKKTNVLMRDLKFYLRKYPALREILLADPDWVDLVPERKAK